mmetsp:Transcript_20106/g.58151  ORF Transcript_20106/g.58151 Transcript_20106/m.58151 type:complete len:82 (+) Transcript_20106:101-346(+)
MLSASAEATLVRVVESSPLPRTTNLIARKQYQRTDSSIFSLNELLAPWFKVRLHLLPRQQLRSSLRLHAFTLSNEPRRRRR